jgi:hypothetical protein
MKPRKTLAQLPVMAALAITLLPAAAVAQGAKIKLPDFSGLAEKASESVDISLDGEALKSAIPMFFPNTKANPNDPQITEMLKGLQGVYVKVFEFDKPGVYSVRDIENLVKQVERDGWKKLLSVREEDERVEMWIRDSEDGGMFFVASEPDELVMINIVGKINLAMLQQMGGRMGMPNIPGILGPPAPPAAPAAPAAPRATQPAQPPQPAAQPAR